MKLTIVTTLFLFCFINIQGQEYFDAGIKVLEKAEFRKADSLFSISIKLIETYDAYFNRAIARMGLNNIEGSCGDLLIMSDVFNDTESSQLYNTRCCLMVDTVYYNSKYEIVDREQFRNYRIRRVHKYSGDTTISYHRKNGNFGKQAIVKNESGYTGFKIKKTNIYARSIMLNGSEVFNFIYQKYPECRPFNAFYEFDKNASKTLKTKYPQIQDNTTLNVVLLLSPDGEIEQILSFSLSKNFDFSESHSSFAKDLNEIFQELPDYRAITFNKHPVYFQFQVEINF